MRDCRLHPRSSNHRPSVPDASFRHVENEYCHDQLAVGQLTVRLKLPCALALASTPARTVAISFRLEYLDFLHEIGHPLGELQVPRPSLRQRCNVLGLRSQRSANSCSLIATSFITNLLWLQGNAFRRCSGAKPSRGRWAGWREVCWHHQSERSGVNRC